MHSFSNTTIGFFFALFACTILSVVSIGYAWTDPTGSPPTNNVAAPINVSTNAQEKFGGLYISDLLEGDSLAVYGNTILGGSNRYLNFGTTAGDAGYGIRDNAGTMQYKNSADSSWTNLGGGGTLWLASGNNVYNTNSGNVGVGGVPTSGARLHVIGAAGSPKIYMNGTDGGIQIGPLNSSWSHIYSDNTAQPFIFNTDVFSIPGGFSSYNSNLFLKTSTGGNVGTTRLTISNSTGNVGIGGVPSTARLDVTASGNDIAVYANAPGANYGVYGISSAYYGIQGRTLSASYAGVLGYNHNATTYGMLGYSTYGVYGDAGSSGGYGVYGRSDGNYGIYGRSSSASYGGVLGYNAAGTAYGILGYGSGYSFYGSGTSYNNGTVYGNSFIYNSDSRLKENIEKMKDGLAKILALNPVSFTWKKDIESTQAGKDDIGFIAQEVEKVLPGLVTTDEKGIKGVDYVRVVPVLVQALQEQQAEIDALKADVAALKAVQR